MRGISILIILAMASAALAAAQSTGGSPRVYALAGKPTKAISGDRFLFLGEELKLSDLTCPPTDTDKGRNAKALLNTVLRRPGFFSCDISDTPTGRSGDCTISKRKGLVGKNIAEAMVKSRLCYHTSSPVL